MKQKKLLFLFLTSFLIISSIGKKIFDFASPPTKDKDCFFIYPQTIDQTKSTNIFIDTPQYLTFAQKGGFINDSSCLNKTAIYGILKVQNEQDIYNAVKFAAEHKIKLTSSGQRHSMGGQSFMKDGIVLDMRQFNKIQIDTELTFHSLCP